MSSADNASVLAVGDTLSIRMPEQTDNIVFDLDNPGQVQGLSDGFELNFLLSESDSKELRYIIENPNSDLDLYQDFIPSDMVFDIDDIKLISSGSVASFDLYLDLYSLNYSYIDTNLDWSDYVGYESGFIGSAGDFDISVGTPNIESYGEFVNIEDQVFVSSDQNSFISRVTFSDDAVASTISNNFKIKIPDDINHFVFKQTVIF